MSRETASVPASSWLELRDSVDPENYCAVDPYLLNRVLLALLATAASATYDVHGAEPYLLLTYRPITLKGATEPISPGTFTSLAMRSRANYSKTRELCAWCGFDLEGFLSHVFKHSLYIHDADETVRHKSLRTILMTLNTVELAARFKMTPPKLLISVHTKRYMDALANDESAEGLEAAAWLATKKTVEREEFREKFPGVFDRVIAPILGADQNYIKIEEPLLEPMCQTRFREALAKPRSEADTLLGFGQFIPCSLETDELLRAHHQGVARRLFKEDPSTGQKWMSLFNTMGTANAEGTRNALRTGHLKRFLHVMKESVIGDIVHGRGDFAHVDGDCVDRWRARLCELEDEFGSRIKIVLVPKENESIFEERFPDVESVFFYTKSGRALSATIREANSAIGIERDPDLVNETLAKLTDIIGIGNSVSTGQLERMVAKAAMV